ncbi:hypothetical protein [Oryzihumus leptocrescens]|uniref:Uncharacterized protein n=1 Tax=Oryzihumus leptocrescens TaxID=297536 RepID=A0A542ZG92_9MICO|nr:hypothetical protein [Oryzihumus leptocrescens]TQL59351.1 hypothetical protein FB474_0705 [Oryzihumus leptocrescens]
MDTQNHFYGHTAALAAYAGMARPRHVAGLIQHGWTAIPPIPVNFGDFPDVEKNGRRKLFVWSHESRAWDPSRSPRQSFALGAPWAYLISTPTAQRQLTGTKGVGTLIMPLHGTRIIPVQGNQGSLAKDYLRREGPSTVCLHSEDVHKPEVVGSWVDAGHRVVTAGPRHDPDFLGRVLSLVVSHERLVANRLMTSVLYAAAAGRDIAVYGDPLGLGGADVVSQDEVARTWPELHGEQVDREVAGELARRELGFQHLLEPEPLREVLGWSRPSVTPAVEYWASAPLHKALNVLGLGERDPGSTEKQVGASPTAWLRHPLSHLPKPLPRRATSLDPLPAPIPVAG